MNKLKVILSSIGLTFVSAISAVTSTFAWLVAQANAEKYENNVTMTVFAPDSTLEITDGEQEWNRDTVAVLNGNKSLQPVAHDNNVTASSFSNPNKWYYKYASDPDDSTGGTKTYLTEDNFNSYVFKQRFYFRSDVGVPEGIMVDEINIPTYYDEELGQECSTGITAIFVGPTGEFVEYNETYEEGWAKHVKLTNEINAIDDDNLTPTNQWVDAYIYIDGNNENVKDTLVSKLAGDVSFKFSKYIDKRTVNLQLKCGKNGDPTSIANSFGANDAVPYIYFYNSKKPESRTKEYEYSPAPGDRMELVKDNHIDQGSGEIIRTYTFDLLILQYDKMVITVIDSKSNKRKSQVMSTSDNYNEKYICLYSDKDTDGTWHFDKWINPITFKNDASESASECFFVYGEDNRPLTYDLMAPIPVDPTGQNRSFVGWTTVPGGNVVNPMKSSTNHATTYYAKWSTTKSTMTIYLQVKKETFGNGMTLIPVPGQDVVQPFIWLWNNSTSLTEVMPGDKMEPVKNITGKSEDALPEDGVYFDGGCNQYVTLWKYTFPVTLSFNSVLFTRSAIEVKDAAHPYYYAKSPDFKGSLSDNREFYISDSFERVDEVEYGGTYKDAAKYKRTVNIEQYSSEGSGYTTTPVNRVQFFTDSTYATNISVYDNLYMSNNTKLAEQHFPALSKITVPAGKKFVGWTTNGTDSYATGDSVTKSLKLYPKFEDLKYYVKVWDYNSSYNEYELSVSNGVASKSLTITSGHYLEFVDSQGTMYTSYAAGSQANTAKSGAYEIYASSDTYKLELTISTGVIKVTTTNYRTILFTNNINVGNIHLHYWGGSTSSTWPGIVMNEHYTNAQGQKVYLAIIPKSTTSIIINNGTSQDSGGWQSNDYTSLKTDTEWCYKGQDNGYGKKFSILRW